MGTRNRFAPLLISILGVFVTTVLILRLISRTPELSGLLSGPFMTSDLTLCVEAVIVGAGILGAGWWALSALLLLVAQASREGSRLRAYSIGAVKRIGPRSLRLLVASVAGASLTLTALPAGAHSLEGTQPSAHSISASAEQVSTSNISTDTSNDAQPQRAGAGVGAGSLNTVSIGFSAAPTQQHIHNDVPASSTPSKEPQKDTQQVALGFLDDTATPQQEAHKEVVQTKSGQQELGQDTEAQKPTQKKAVQTKAAQVTHTKPEKKQTDHVQPQPESAASPKSVTVAPGDSLWSIAAGLLSKEATNPQIADAWQSLYSANSENIGADPDRIEVGLVLTIPAELR